MATTETTNWADIQLNSINMHAEVHSRVHNKLLQAFGAGANWVVKGFDLSIYADTVSGVNALCAQITPGVAVHDTTVIDFESGMAGKATHIYVKVFDINTAQPAQKTWYLGVRYNHGLVGSGITARPSVATLEAVPYGGDLTCFNAYYTLLLAPDYPTGTITPSKIKIIDHRYDTIALYEHIKFLSNRHTVVNLNYGYGSGGFLFYRESDGYTDHGMRVDPHMLRLNRDRSFIIEDESKNIFPDTNFSQGLRNWTAVNTDSSVEDASGGFTDPVVTKNDIAVIDTVYGKGVRLTGKSSGRAFNLVSTTTFPVNAGDWFCVSFKYRKVSGSVVTPNVGWTSVTRGASIGWTSAYYINTQIETHERVAVDLGDGWFAMRGYIPIHFSSTYNLNAPANKAALFGITGLPDGSVMDIVQFHVEKMQSSWMNVDDWVFQETTNERHIVWDASEDALCASGPTKMAHESLIPINSSVTHYRVSVDGRATTQAIARGIQHIGFRVLDSTYKVITTPYASGAIKMWHAISTTFTPGYATYEISIPTTELSAYPGAKYLQPCFALNYSVGDGSSATIADKMWLRNLEIFEVTASGETPCSSFSHIRFSTYTPKKRKKDRFYIPTRLLTPTMGQIDVAFNPGDSVLCSPKTGFLWQILTPTGYYGVRYKRLYKPTSWSVQFIMKSSEQELILESPSYTTSATKATVTAVWSKIGSISLYVNGSEVETGIAGSSFVFEDVFTSDLTIGSNVAHTAYADARFYNIRVKALSDMTDAQIIAAHGNNTLFVMDPTTIALIPNEQGLFLPLMVVDSVVPEEDDDGSEVTLLDEEIITQLECLKATMNRECLVSTGIASYSTDGYFLWDKFELIATGRNSNFTKSGKFIIDIPASGSPVKVVGGATPRSFTTEGILLNSGEALYYELPLGTMGDSKPTNFYVVADTPTKDYTIPAHWVLLAVAYGS